MDRVYYNENDPYAAQWLRNLIAAGHLPAGHVDERSIADVQPDDLEGYIQCHFFAGIGGWPLALRMAGWPDDRPVWTGSCPCQPFSGAGRQQGEKDKRHLWPEFLRLIVEWEVPTIFGEQVASALGRQWLVGVSADLEDLDYVVGAADLCAAGAGAPHIRQRLYWVAHAAEQRWRALEERSDFANGGPEAQPGRLCGTGRLVDAQQPRLEGQSGDGAGGFRYLGQVPQPDRSTGTTGDAFGAWSDCYVIPCSDGKARRSGSGVQPLAHGVPNRVGRLRAYGNAIVPQVAALFITAIMD